MMKRTSSVWRVCTSGLSYAARRHQSTAATVAPKPVILPTPVQTSTSEDAEETAHTDHINMSGKLSNPTREVVGPQHALSHNVRNLPMSPSVRINEIQQDMVEQGRKVYRMGFGQSPFPVHPLMINSLKEHASDSAYCDTQGLWELRDAVAKMHVIEVPVREGITADNVMIGPGSKGIFLCL